MLVTVKDVNDVVKAMKFYIDNPEKRAQMGITARRSVEEKFDQTTLFEALMKNRDELI